jgi:hypothetical protein
MDLAFATSVAGEGNLRPVGGPTRSYVDAIFCRKPDNVTAVRIHDEDMGAKSSDNREGDPPPIR